MMNCKNCYAELDPTYEYCYACGAKVINSRITLKGLLSDSLESFGWDNRYFVTFRDLVVRPQVVFREYLNGTRKKHANPFTFFAIGVALTVFVFGFYSDELVDISTQASLKPTETLMNNITNDDGDLMSEANTLDMDKLQSLTRSSISFQIKYYYQASFLLLPFYAFIALLVFGRPENFGEHLVINAYVQGLMFFFGLILVFLTFLLQSDVFSLGSIIVMIVYYSYAYGRYRKYSFWQSIKKLLKFFAIIFIVFLILMVIGVLIAMRLGL